MTKYDTMQALAHRATRQQIVDAAQRLGWTLDVDGLVIPTESTTGIREKFCDPATRESRLASEFGQYAVAYQARGFTRDGYHSAMESAAGCGAGTIAKQRGTAAGSPERSAEDGYCGRVIDALESAGVVIAGQTETEAAFSSCGGSFTSI